MTAETIARALGGRRTGGGWVARCPAHDDHRLQRKRASGRRPLGPGELAAARVQWWTQARAEGLAPVPGLIVIPGGRL